MYSHNIEYARHDDGKHATIFHKKTGTEWTITATPELEEMVLNPHFSFIVEKIMDGVRWRNDARIALFKRGTPRRVTAPYFQRVAFDSYHNGTNVLNALDYYKKNEECFNAYTPTIDHLDMDVYNDTKENLFEMPMCENSKKAKIQKKIWGRFNVALANDGTFCRIQFA